MLTCIAFYSTGLVNSSGNLQCNSHERNDDDWCEIHRNLEEDRNMQNKISEVFFTQQYLRSLLSAECQLKWPIKNIGRQLFNQIFAQMQTRQLLKVKIREQIPEVLALPKHAETVQIKNKNFCVTN